MGYRPIRTIIDADRHRITLWAYCHRCRRKRRLGNWVTLSLYFGVKADSDIEALKPRLRCRKCRARGCDILMAQDREEPPDPRPRSPRGIDPAKWEAADHYERKRLIRQARG